MTGFETKKGTKLPIANLRGKDYLEVKYRIVWFREERPDWSIETEFIEVSNEYAVAKATIRNEQGRIVATSHKHEDKKGFGDFREKAETGAIGRALALIGYGTAFASELEEEDRIVDAPIARPTEYRIPFPKSKHQGKRLDEVPIQELLDYGHQLQNFYSELEKPLPDNVQDFIKRVNIKMTKDMEAEAER